jgi:hypothetical protein
MIFVNVPVPKLSMHGSWVDESGKDECTTGFVMV